MNAKNNQIIRHGAYGIVLHDSKILLTQKKSGPYKDLWGLPGGSIEFGETPEDALKRELLEECALTAGQLNFFNIITATGTYDNDGVQYGFHQVGLIYQVFNISIQPDVAREEENAWIHLDEVVFEKLTPFAKQVIRTKIVHFFGKPSANT